MNKVLKKEIIEWFRDTVSAVMNLHLEEHYTRDADYPAKDIRRLSRMRVWESRCEGKYIGMLTVLTALGLEKEARTLQRLNHWAERIGEERYLNKKF